MDVALLLILPVIGGYYFANQWNYTRFHARREEGHRLYFRAVLYGTLLFMVAYIVRVLLTRHVAPYEAYERSLAGYVVPLFDVQANTNPANGFGIAVTSMLSLLLGVTAWAPLNRLFPRDWLLRDAVKNDDFERLIHTAVARDSPLSVTVENQKVYVGFVVKSTDPTQERKKLGILPVMSGYRRADGGVEFTTYYSDVYEEIDRGAAGRLAHLTPEDFEIVLPVDKVVSANMFDIVAYEEFGRRKRTKHRSSRRAKSRRR